MGTGRRQRRLCGGISTLAVHYSEKTELQTQLVGHKAVEPKDLNR